MPGLYGCRTRRLLAFGHSVFDSHHTVLIASFTRIRRTVTHSAGLGRLPTVEILRKVKSALHAKQDEQLEVIKAAHRLTGLPGVTEVNHPLPVSFRMRCICSTNGRNQSMYSPAATLP